MNLRLLRCLVGRADAREFWNLAFPRLLVQALGIACLGDFEGQVDEDLDEGKGRVCAGGYGVQVTRLGAVGFVG